MQVKFFANMRTIIGETSLVVENGEVNSFRKLVAYLIELYPRLKYHLLDSNDDLRQDVPVYVNGRNPRLSVPEGIDSPLERDSIVSFFSPISSGRMNVEVLREPVFGKKE